MDKVLENQIPVIVSTKQLDVTIRDQILSKSVIDYIITENENGWEYVLSFVKRVIRNADIKVLCVEDSRSDRFLKKGGADFLAKPFVQEEFFLPD